LTAETQRQGQAGADPAALAARRDAADQARQALLQAR